MTKLPPCRLYFLLAREAPLAVVFRRGPSKLVQVLQWNLETDQFTAGQWLQGRIYERRCDLSPHGKLLAIFAANHRATDWRKTSWTAISRPPYLTALALWFKGDCWSGGGLFPSNEEFHLNEGGLEHQWVRSYPKPPLFVRPVTNMVGEDSPIENARRIRDGWSLVQDLKATIARPKLPPIMKILRANPAALDRWLADNEGGFGKGYTTKKPQLMRCQYKGHTLEEERSLTGFKERRELRLDGQSLPEVTHIDFDPARNRLVGVTRGTLFAQDLETGQRTVLADFTANTFAPVVAPAWALQWPS